MQLLDIGNLDLIPQYFQEYGTPIFRGLFEDNDPSKRLIAIANYNTDLSEFWEFAGILPAERPRAMPNRHRC